MTRQRITVIDAPGAYDSDGQVLALTTWDSATHTDGLDYVSTGNEIIVCQNTGAGSRACTITSVADDLSRTGDATKSIAAGAFHIFGPMKKKGWAQADGTIRIVPAHAEVKLAVIRLP